MGSGLAVALAVAGCATVPPADVAGRWSGSWAGYGLLDIPREAAAFAELVQTGAEGRGRLVLDGTTSAASVPIVLRHSGAAGARVIVSVKGSRVAMVHELGRDLFAADFTVEGDRMVGRIRDAEPAVDITLFRVTDEVSGPGASTPGTAEKLPSSSEAPEPPAPMPRANAVAVRVDPHSPQATPPAGPASYPLGREPDAVTAPADALEGQAATGAAPVNTGAPGGAQADTAAVHASRPSPVGFAAVPELVSIHFDFDRFELRPEEADRLEANAQWLKEHEGLAVLIQGHTDVRGTSEYNLVLSERRARSTRDFLAARGVSTSRMTVIFYGEERPLCAESTEDCWRQNRRAEFVVRAVEEPPDPPLR